MDVATGFDRELSLEAMWHAYRASDFAAQNNVAIDTGVVHDLLMRVYQDSLGDLVTCILWAGQHRRGLRTALLKQCRSRLHSKRLWDLRLPAHIRLSRVNFLK